ncbi:serine hydrolase [Streptomyces sp. NPDC040724]|uniref:D-alanyl-D-alanine carboxypeptidase n=1 Tax=Streptomyces sp. NPDC040724 TaxID=3155612 RepID=UPI0033F4B750
MKAVTVAGGSSDDPEIEQGTTVPETEPVVAPDSRGSDEARTGAGAEATPQADAEAGAGAAGEAATGPATPAEPGADTKVDAKAQVEPQTNAEAESDPDAADEASTGPATEAEPEAEAAPEGKAAAEPGAQAEPEADAEVLEPAAGAKADAESGPRAEATGRATTQAAPAAHPVAGAEPEAETTAGTRTPAAAKALADAEAGAQPEAEAEPEVDAAGEAATQATPAARPKAGADTGAGAEPDAETAAGTGTPAAAEGEVDRQTEAEEEADAAGEAATQAAPSAPGAGADTGFGVESEAAAEALAGAEGDATGGAEAQAQAQAETEADAAGGAAGGTGTLATAKGDTEGGAEAQAEAEPEADAAGEAATQAAPSAHGAGADTGFGAEPESAAAAAAEALADAEGDATGGAGAQAGAEAEAHAAGGAAGGTGAPVAAEGDAEGGVEAQAGAETEVDGAGGAGGPVVPEGGAGAEATQVIAVPRPRRVASGGSPRVPAWARADADAERTSEFVALKDLDVPPPAAPEAKPAARVQPRPPEAPPRPLPALDLLAELTNTPPTPETPRRTALRRVKVWTPILLVLAGAYVAAQMLRPLPAPQMVAAETGLTVDGQFSLPWPGKGQGAVRVVGSGDLGTFGEQKPVPTASVAKVMTAYVILKGHPLRKSDPGPEITVDQKTVADGTSENESRISGLTVGQKFSQQDMLKMLMIPSGNNVARLLARWDTGTDSEAAFVEKMNAAAKELGMNSTTYTDPSGLDAGTVSTATDQLKLAEAVMKDETFRSIVVLPSAAINGLPQKLTNNNVLLTDRSLSVVGIKTGSSTPAGGTLMWAAYKSVGDKDHLILGTLMDQRVDGPDLNAEKSLALVQENSKKIIKAVRGALASTPVIRKGQPVGYLDDGLGGRMPLVATKDLNVIGVPGQQLKLSLVAGPSPLPHSAKAGTEVAVLTVGEGEGAKSVPVAVQTDMAEPSFGTRMTRLG